MTDLTSSLRIALVDDVSSPAGKMAAAIKAAEVQAKELDRVMTAAGSAGVSDRLLAKLKAMGAGADHVKGVAKAFQDLAKAEGLAEDRSKWTVKQAQAIRNLESVTTAQVRSQIGMERALATEQARNHARHMQEMVRERESIMKSRGALHALGTAAATAVSAHSVISATEHSLAAGANYQAEIVALKNAGQTDPRMLARIQARAREVARSTPTSTLAENLRVTNETIQAFGNVEHAMENLEFMQKTASVLHTAAGDRIHMEPGDMASKFAKFFEMRGTAIDSDKFRNEAGQMVQSMAFTRGKFNPDEMFNFAGSAGRATLGAYDMHFLSRIVPTLVGDRSGDTVGTQAKAFRRLIMGTVSDQQQAKEWMRLGLIDPSQVNMKAGHVVSWKAGAVRGSDLAASDPLAFFEQRILPAIKGSGINIMDQKALSTELALLFRKGSANDFAESLAQFNSRRQLHSDDINTGRAGSLEEIYRRNLTENPQVGFDAMKSGLEDLMSAATSPLMKPAGEALEWLAKKLQEVADVAQQHPVAAPVIGGVTAGAALAGAGAASYYAVRGITGGFKSMFRSPTGPARAGATAGEILQGADASAVAAGRGLRLGGLLGSTALAFGAGMSMGLMPDILTPDQMNGGKGLQPMTPADMDALRKRAEAMGQMPLWQRLLGMSPGDSNIVVDEDRITRARGGDYTRPARLSVPGDQGLHFDEGSGPAQQSWWHRIFGSASDESDKLKASFADLSAGAQAASMTLASLSAGDLGGGSGGGLINASYEAGGTPDLTGGTLAGGSGKGIGHYFSAEQRAANIRSAALANGIDPRYAMAVARSEGFGKFTGDRGTSFGDFQMHIGGGLGDRYRRATGKNPADPRNELDLDRFALGEASKGGWGPWHGAARIGIHGHAGMGRPRRAPTESHPLAGAVTALNDASATPMINTRHLERTAALLDHIHGRLDDINGMGVGARPGSYRSAMNGSFAVDAWRRSA